MDISKIDKNFSAGEVVGENGKTYYKIPHANFNLYGVYFDEKNSRFVRMDQDVAAGVSDGVNYLSKDTAGGRVRFSTDSVLIGVRVKYDVFCRMTHMPFSGSAGFTLLEERENGCKFIRSFRPDHGNDHGYSQEIAIAGGKMRDYILYFPLYNHVTSLEIILDEDAKVENGRKYRDIKPILYYGSSITQGGCASRPDNAYQAHIAKWNNIDFINLGFSGGAKAEARMVDYLTGLDCSVFVCDYDHNAPTPEYLEETHYLLYKTYRSVRKDTPILFISKPDYDNDPDAQKREAIIYNTYAQAKKAGDKNVYFLVGRTFYGEEDRENCSVDGCHPNDLGFYYMAKGIYKKLQEIDPIFK